MAYPSCVTFKGYHTRSRSKTIAAAIINNNNMASHQSQLSGLAPAALVSQASAGGASPPPEQMNLSRLYSRRLCSFKQRGRTIIRIVSQDILDAAAAAAAAAASPSAGSINTTTATTNIPAAGITNRPNDQDTGLLTPLPTPPRGGSGQGSGQGHGQAAAAPSRRTTIFGRKRMAATAGGRIGKSQRRPSSLVQRVVRIDSLPLPPGAGFPDLEEVPFTSIVKSWRLRSVINRSATAGQPGHPRILLRVDLRPPIGVSSSA